MAPRKAQRQTVKADAPDVRAAGPLRIVLVGRTGLDGRLRLDPAIELVRARTPLDAIGELAAAVQHDGKLATVVIVASSSDPGLEEAPGASSGSGAPAGKGDPGKRREFLAALRRLDPRVRILRLHDSTQTNDTDGREGYDGMLKIDAGAEDIRAILNGRSSDARTGVSTPAADAGQAVPAPESEQLSTLIDTLAAGKGAPELGDETVVRLLLQGRDITDAAIDIIRRRLGGRDVAFVTAGRGSASSSSGGADDPAGGPSSQEISVAWRGRLLGRLRSEDVPAEQLIPHAAWLASWLTLRDQHAQLREAAFADPLTGAHNRRYFDQFLAMAMDEARKERRGVTLLMFDIDDFKQFNDRYGHAAGDDILRETVRLLRSVIRPSDKVCRIGGDEFAVIFHEPTGPRTPSSRPPSDVCQIAERFQREITAHKFPKLGREAPGTLTVSGGLATYPWDGMTPETLLARADDLAMQSKRAGKNVITIGPVAEEGQMPDTDAAP